MMDPFDHKQGQVPLNQIRRVYYGEDHEMMRPQIPFPQAHLYPPSLSIRGGPIGAPGYLPPAVSQDPHMDDPRYVPQDLMLLMRDMDEKRMRYYGYPMATQGNLNILGPPLLASGGFTAPVPSAIASGAALNAGPGGLGVGPALSSGLGALGNNTLNAPNAIPQPPNTNVVNAAASSKKEDHGLVLPIPPLHVQQQIANSEDKTLKSETENDILSKCLRCKKDFVQRLIMPKDGAKTGAEPKVYKLCHHCRDLQRQRSRRWQKKTKDKHGACRRCGSEIPPQEQKFVLCPQCRENLRLRKANRAAQGKCVHCLGPINALIMKEDTDENGRRTSTLGSYKVCQRCRENDKIRRTNLERMGNCNRCAKTLSAAEQGKHKVCLSCRQKKKKQGSAAYQGIGLAPPGVLAQPMSYIPAEQGMMMQAPPMQPEYPVAFAGYQPILQAPPYAHGGEPPAQIHGYQAPRSYQRDRM